MILWDFWQWLICSAAPNKQPTGTRLRIPIKKPPQNSKVHYISPEEAKVLGSSSSTSHFAFRPPVNKPYESKTEVVPPSNPPPKFRIKPYLPVGPSGSREPLNNWSMPSCIKDEKLAASTGITPFLLPFFKVPWNICGVCVCWKGGSWNV